MREIKFRAWTKRDKCFIFGFSIHKSGLFSSLINAKIVGKVAISDAHWEQLNDESDIVLMQYTGIKDKDGIEIYEGDIVKAKNKYNSTPTKFPKYEIVFAYGKFFGQSLKRHSVAGKGLRQITLDLNDWEEMETCKVIGNIYENLELK